MKIRVSHLPYLALALGAAGSGLRRVQLSTGFEPDTGLARLDSWINPLLPLFLAAAVLALFFLSLPFQGKRLSFCQCFLPPTGAAVPLVTTGAFLFFLSGGLYLLQYIQGDGTEVELVLGAFAVFLTFSVLYAARRWRQKEAVDGALLLPPVAFFLLLLLTAYLAHGTFPVVARYGPEILALAAMTYGFYQIAAAGYRQGARRALSRCCGIGVVLGLTAAADLACPAESAALAGGVLVLLAFALSLRTAGGKDGGKPEEVSPPAEP